VRARRVELRGNLLRGDGLLGAQSVRLFQPAAVALELGRAAYKFLCDQFIE
jgi:hypothetical protein